MLSVNYSASLEQSMESLDTTAWTEPKGSIGYTGTMRELTVEKKTEFIATEETAYHHRPNTQGN